MEKKAEEEEVDDEDEDEEDGEEEEETRRDGREWPNPQYEDDEHDDAPSDDDGMEEDEGEGDGDGDGDGSGASHSLLGGTCYRRFIYAMRTQDGKVPAPSHKGKKRRKDSTVKTVAAQRAGQAFYGIIQVDQILGPAPLHRPAYPWDKHKWDAWDPERKPLSKRGHFILQR